MPISAQYVLLFAGVTISFACGVAMLKGANWGRTVYVGWSVLGFVIARATLPIKIAIVPGAVVFAIISFFLYRPKAAAYFSQKEANWKRDAGVVLLSTWAFNALIVLSIACLFTSEEMRRLMPSDIFGSLDAYATGGIVIAGFAALGWVLFRQAAAPDRNDFDLP